MTDEQHIEAARKWIDQMRATELTYERRVNEASREIAETPCELLAYQLERIAERDTSRFCEVATARESLDRVVELAEQVPELLRVMREMHDYGHPTTHYRDWQKGNQAWSKAAELLRRLEGME